MHFDLKMPVLPFYNQQLGHYPVRRLICIGRNYAEHAQEMGQKYIKGTTTQQPPFFFYKPVTALFCTNAASCLRPSKWTKPTFSQNVHHEIEIFIAIGNKVTRSDLDLTDDSNSNSSQSLNAAIIGAGIALDMTCRDTQQIAKDNGRPWAAAKGFDHSAPCSGLMECNWASLQNTPEFALYKNNQRVQHGNINHMIWPIPALLKELSRFTQLDVGDIILTGTPAGVGPVHKGDTLKAELINTPCQFELIID